MSLQHFFFCNMYTMNINILLRIRAQVVRTEKKQTLKSTGHQEGFTFPTVMIICFIPRQRVFFDALLSTLYRGFYKRHFWDTCTLRYTLSWIPYVRFQIPTGTMKHLFNHLYTRSLKHTLQHTGHSTDLFTFPFQSGNWLEVCFSKHFNVYKDI